MGRGYIAYRKDGEQVLMELSVLPIQYPYCSDLFEWVGEECCGKPWIPFVREIVSDLKKGLSRVLDPEVLNEIWNDTTEISSQE